MLDQNKFIKMTEEEAINLSTDENKNPGFKKRMNGLVNLKFRFVSSSNY